MRNNSFKTLRYFKTIINTDHRTMSLRVSECHQYSLATLQCDLAGLGRTVCGPTFNEVAKSQFEKAGNVAPLVEHCLRSTKPQVNQQ